MCRHDLLPQAGYEPDSPGSNLDIYKGVFSSPKRPEPRRGPPCRLLDAGRQADYTLPSTVEVKNEWNYTSTPPIHLHGISTHNFTFSYKKQKVVTPNKSHVNSATECNAEFNTKFC
jgi:hypothetical protein